MAPRSKKERVFMHMAREVPDYKIVYVDRDDLLFGRNIEPDIPFLVEKALGTWVRWTKIKHGTDATLELYTEFDIDFNRYRLVGRLRPKRYV